MNMSLPNRFQDFQVPLQFNKLREYCYKVFTSSISRFVQQLIMIIYQQQPLLYYLQQIINMTLSQYMKNNCFNRWVYYYKMLEKDVQVCMYISNVIALACFFSCNFIDTINLSKTSIFKLVQVEKSLLAIVKKSFLMWISAYPNFKRLSLIPLKSIVYFLLEFQGNSQKVKM